MTEIPNKAVAKPGPADFRCEFVEEDDKLEMGWRCTVCGAWFSAWVCDGEMITKPWWRDPECKRIDEK